MCAFLVALLPMAAAEEAAPAGADASSSRRHPLLRVYYSFWAVMFSLGLIDPLLAIAKDGTGGSSTTRHRAWYAGSDSAQAHAYGAGMFWTYRIFGFHSHPIFIDDQFTLNSTQTRLPFHPNAAGHSPHDIFDISDAGQAFRPPAYNRRFVAWNYRTVYPPIPLLRVEARLSRFLAFHVGRGDIDLEQGWVTIEQRPIEMPVDAWRAGQRERNTTGAWQRVGVVHGSPGELRYTWRDPCWSIEEKSDG